jgi:hypothetical protein
LRKKRTHLGIATDPDKRPVAGYDVGEGRYAVVILPTGERVAVPTAVVMPVRGDPTSVYVDCEKLKKAQGVNMAKREATATITVNTQALSAMLSALEAAGKVAEMRESIPRHWKLRKAADELAAIMIMDKVSFQWRTEDDQRVTSHLYYGGGCFKGETFVSVGTKLGRHRCK